MKIIFAFVLCALLATTFGFRIRQPAGANQLAQGLTTAMDNGLEDTELVTHQAIEDTEAYTNCMLACTNPMPWAQCATDCFTTATNTAASQLAEDTTTFTNQMANVGGAAPAAAD